MLIFWKPRLALLAVPKTGTTALENALASSADAAIVNPPGLKHCTVRKYRRDLSGFFEQKGKRPLSLVAVMREPVDWLGSWYRYRGRDALAGQENSTAGMTFDAFVQAYLQDNPPACAKVGSQAAFLEGGVDHLFRYDRPSDLIDFLRDRLGQPVEVGRANVSPDGDLTLSRQTRAALETGRGADFELWSAL
ncbi:hypothetical protein [Jannaschia donghaensis]|uniref:Gamma-glutamyl kinase n=1 Tax=Jannaschia donghaensis TaxID=420998 RepID=A0A0M6YJB1_9RHOB|nr:hypothetical protein [Jannaschia donghaensis]CTQ50448.1 hypothetical protein JDO7802_02472 [Jannaschia donghaensis]